MGIFSFFANSADPEDEGGFCDTDSKVHYCNESRDEMKNNAAVHCEHSGATPDIRDDDESERFNTTIFEADRLSSQYPARYEPGK